MHVAFVLNVSPLHAGFLLIDKTGTFIFSYVITFNQSETSVDFILTLSELVTVPNPHYNFTFTHVLTKDVVSFQLGIDDDTSESQSRYNSFTIDTTQFEHVGEWHYVVTEIETGTVLESGKMIILRDFNFTMYDGATSYKSYAG